MAKVRALNDFAGSTINRDELGIVRKGTEVEVSANDAAYLERDGLVERVEEEPAPAVTSAAESSDASTPASGPADGGRSSSGEGEST